MNAVLALGVTLVVLLLAGLCGWGLVEYMRWIIGYGFSKTVEVILCVFVPVGTLTFFAVWGSIHAYRI